MSTQPESATGRAYQSLFMNAVSYGAAILSLSKLFQAVWDHRYGDVFQSVIDSYDKIVGAVTFMLNPLAAHLAGLLSSWLEVDLVLQDYWRHVFFLLILYFGGDAVFDWQRGRTKVAWRWSAVVTAVSGLVLAFVAGVAAGLMDEAPPARIMALAVLCVTIYELQRAVMRVVIDPLQGDRVQPPLNPARSGRVQTFERLFSRFVSSSFLLGCAAIAAVAVIDPPGRSQSTILGFLIYVLLLALRNLGQGLYMVLFHRRSGEGRLEQLRSYKTAMLGLRILIIMVAVAAGTLLAAADNL